MIQFHSYFTLAAVESSWIQLLVMVGGFGVLVFVGLAKADRQVKIYRRARGMRKKAKKQESKSAQD